MTGESRLQLRPAIVIVVAVMLVAAGAAATYFAMRRTGPPTSTEGAGASAAISSVAPPLRTATASNDVMAVTLSAVAVDRAGITLQPVSTSTITKRLRLPGTVQPNAYRTTVVTSIVGGRITRVSADLGQAVRRGQMLAEVYSPELADAQTRFVASSAELEAHERELRRTEKLVELGSASRQELEKIHAAHTAALSMLQSYRSRLTLLGMSDAQLTKLASSTTVTTTVSIPSPLDGVVTTREANVGLNVDPSVPLFTVADLSTVWIVGDLNERDLAGVRVGSPATIMSNSLPGFRREGKVSYIDPQLKVETRTAQLRIEIPNPDRQLRLGMYVDVEVGEVGPAMAVAVPRSAVQVVGDRSVVYVANPAQPGQFVERVVETGNVAGDVVEIVSGVKTGEFIVAKGSFAVRAEAERLGMRASSQTNPTQAGPPVVSGFSQTSGTRITVTEKGFEPSRVALRAGVPARLTFVRTTDATCATEVVIPSLNITRALPLNEPVTLEFIPAKPGDVAFACGMSMFSGTLVIQ